MRNNKSISKPVEKSLITPASTGKINSAPNTEQNSILGPLDDPERMAGWFGRKNPIIRNTGKMSRKIILLFDSPVGDDHFLYRALKQEGLTVRKVDSPSRYPSILNWAIGCMKATFGPQATDTIVCWYDFQAVLCYWIGRFLFRKRNIVAINILLKDKKRCETKSWHGSIKSIDKQPYGSLCYRPGIRGFSERTLLHEYLFFRVRDVYSPTLYEESDFRFCGNSVFAGDGTGGTGKPSSRRPAGCRMSYSMLSCRKISRRNSGANRFPISTYTAIFPSGNSTGS